MSPRYSEADARNAIASSRSYAEALRRLGMCQTGGARHILRKYVALWGICVAHFDPDAVVREGLRRREPRPLADLLVRGSQVHRGQLKERLYAAGLKSPACEFCGQDELWRGRRMALILDHANGERDDNRLENLRILCPNCNATLDTHCGREGRLDERPCEHCGKRFRPSRSTQRYCSRACGQRWAPPSGPRPWQRRVERPPYDRLLAELSDSSYVAVGRRYGVSDNAIRKWVRAYEREERERGAATAPSGTSPPAAPAVPPRATASG